MTRTSDIADMNIADMNEAAPVGDPETTTGPQRFRWLVAGVGAIVAALGVSGLLDDSGLIEHPWWVSLLAAAALAGGMVSIRTLLSFERLATD